MHLKIYTKIATFVSASLIALSIISLAIHWLFPNLGTPEFAMDYIREIRTMPITHRLLGMIVEAISTLFAIGAFFQLIKLMNRFEKGEFFSAEIASRFMKLSSALLLWAVYSPFKNMLLSVITTLHNPPGHRIFSVTFGSYDLFNILLFSLVMIFAGIIQKAKALQHDHDLTV